MAEENEAVVAGLPRKQSWMLSGQLGHDVGLRMGCNQQARLFSYSSWALHAGGQTGDAEERSRRTVYTWWPWAAAAAVRVLYADDTEAGIG